MINIVSMLFTRHNDQQQHGERDFWREYGEEYAVKLFRGIERHVQQPHRNFLLTDTPDAARAAGATAIEFPVSLWTAPGWWMKLAIFKPGMFLGKTFYTDLDNVVSGPLDPLLNLEPDPILMLDDRVYAGMSNGAALLCYPDRIGFLYREYFEHAEAIRQEFSTWPNASDQAYIASRVRRETRRPITHLQNVLPEGYILNSRAELEDGCDWSKASLVYGSWVPKPHEKTHSPSAQAFYERHWV